MAKQKEIPAAELPEDEVIKEKEMDPMDILRSNLYQEIQRMTQSGDFFVEMAAQSEDIKAAVMEVRALMGQRGILIFPRITEVITVNPEQEEPLTFSTMMMIEMANLQTMHQRFVAWLNTNLAAKVGLPVVSLPTAEGNINMVPLMSDYSRFRDSLLQACVNLFVIEESERSRLQIAQALPSRM